MALLLHCPSSKGCPSLSQTRLHRDLKLSLNQYLNFLGLRGTNFCRQRAVLDLHLSSLQENGWPTDDAALGAITRKGTSWSWSGRGYDDLARALHSQHLSGEFLPSSP